MSEIDDLVDEVFAGSRRCVWLDGGGARDWSGRRSIVGRLTIEEIIRDRAAFASAVAEEAESSLTGQGLVLDTFQLQDIQAEGSYLADLGRPEAARVLKEASIAEARARHARAITAEAEARGRADAIAALARARPPRLDIPVRVFVPETAAAAGFTVRSADAFEPDGVSIVIGSARPAAFFTWLSGLQSRGLVVEALSATPNPDRTLSVRFTARSGVR